MEKIKLRSMVIVEGKYDKIKLDSILDAEIIETDGFSIFKNEQLKEYIRKTALERGIITATDSDGAGLLIRNYLSGIVPPDRIKHVLIPKIPGKESRKAEPSKEGTVGVEGIDADVLRSLFEPFKDDTQPEY
ncbi:MAG: toprim domain-containing protein [Clostridia bacterium]|nr:toprim domain-containing protein [Clostridia bacterium]